MYPDARWETVPSISSTSILMSLSRQACAMRPASSPDLCPPTSSLRFISSSRIETRPPLGAYPSHTEGGAPAAGVFPSPIVAICGEIEFMKRNDAVSLKEIQDSLYVQHVRAVTD